MNLEELQDFNKSIIDEFRSNKGVVGGMFTNVQLLLLTTTGAKSGLRRVNPLACLSDGDRYVIFASYEGGPTNPPWYYNLLSNPEVGVELGGEQFTANATVVGEPERTELYVKMVELMPVFSEYESKTERVIPVVTLSRV
jgi:deazaflavin-dependent oxidoreductase (nitroreductase family)